MDKNFDRALRLVLAHEGGYVNHPKDPGGATNKGVTKAVYDRYRRSKGLEARSVKMITAAEVRDIYRRQYWDAIRGDEMPSGVDYALFDFAVNSGPGRAVQFLQRCIGAGVDGNIGMETIAKTNGMNSKNLIADLCSRRLSWMKTLKTWKTFGKGWNRRVMGGLDGFQKTDFGVIDYAINMANESVGAAVVKTKDMPEPKAIGSIEGEVASGKANASDQAISKTPVGIGGMIAGAGAVAPVVMSASEKVAGHMDKDGWMGGAAIIGFIVLILIGITLSMMAYKARINERA